MEIADYTILGIDNEVEIRKIERIIKEGFNKYNLDDEMKIFIEYGSEDTLVAYSPVGDELYLGDRPFEVAEMTNRETGDTAFKVTVNTIYRDETLYHLSVALSHLLVGQNSWIIEDHMQEDDTLMGVIFAMETYFIAELVKACGDITTMQLMKEYIEEVTKDFSSFIEGDSMCNVCKIRRIMELIGYNYSFNKDKNLQEVLNSSHITVKAFSNLQEKIHTLLDMIFDEEVEYEELDEKLVLDTKEDITAVFRIV